MCRDINAASYRARDVRDVYADLQEFNTRSAELTQWMLPQTESLANADNDGLTSQQLKDKVRLPAIAHQLVIVCAEMIIII